MRNHKQHTKELVRFLKKHPVIVADIFEYGASRVPVPEIVKQIMEFWEPEFSKANVYISDYYVWAMFHRRAPFHDSRIYSQVSAGNREKVSARLYSTDPDFSLDDDPIPEVDGIFERHDAVQSKGEAIADCVDAYEYYQSKLDVAEAHGLNRSTIEQMIREVIS